MMQCRRLGKTVLLIVIFFLVISQSAIAYNVSRISVEPPGALVPGTPVVVSIKIDLPTQPLFPLSHELRYTTELEKPKWDPDILAGGIEYPAIIQGGKFNSLSGFELSNPRVFGVQLQLEGTAPNVLQTSNITLIRIEELDENGRAIDRSTTESRVTILYLKEISCCIEPMDETLQRFKSHIDENTARGVNTSAAERKFTEAQNSMDAASSLPEQKYTEALTLLGDAQNSITEGERLLDKAWAENEITAAQIPINNADAVIAWYKTNDLRLPAILAKRELAVAYITEANEAIATGNYSQAREKAHGAYELGNESYNIALSGQQRQYLGRFCNFNPEIFGFLIIGIIVILLASTGVYFYCRKHR